MAEIWRFINSGKMPPNENMAIDKAILEGVANGISPQTVRIYDWNPPTISFGFHQNIAKYIDLERVKKSGFGIVRRPTGGRAVLHYDEITYAVIAKTDGILKGSILQSYQKIGKVLLATLKKIGIDAEMENGLPSLNNQKKWSNPCFTSASKYEIHYKNKKIIGSAQIRKDGAFLQHGSILLNNNQELMAKFLIVKNENERNILKKYLSKKTIAINQILDSPISFLEFSYKLNEAFEEIFPIKFDKKSGLNKFEKKFIKKIIEK